MKNISFEINPEIIEKISEQFSPETITEDFCSQIKNKSQDNINELGKRFFLNYGNKLMKKSLELGEKYSDRTYEVLREAADNTKSLTFPLVPQRFIEIAYLSIQNIEILHVVENNSRRFIFSIENCRIFNQVTQRCGKDVANSLYCRYGCLEACRTAFNSFDYDSKDLNFNMLAQTQKDGYCSFEVSKGDGKFPWENYPITYNYIGKRKKKKEKMLNIKD